MFRAPFIAPIMVMAFALSAPVVAQESAADSYCARWPGNESIYFLLPDRFENGDRGRLIGDRLKTRCDPTARVFFLGGNLKELINRPDYIHGLDATAIWPGPILRNKPVQSAPGAESAGQPAWTYRSRADYLYRQRSGPEGKAINPSFACTPYLPKGEEILQRTLFAHAMLLLLRVVPIIYAANVQGFTRGATIRIRARICSSARRRPITTLFCWAPP